ncbi:hypothetical protein EJ08DRAFT_626413 [Tothia fuscella]|uniref:Uncharacterized protein n=1 Tax=Tothia fuscella TaxID=1048955 RepID=A0A9P4U2P8_9PEZI|nr:hypothetical protein EJ08DRAFT_626413 [Tothia fuscella]
MSCKLTQAENQPFLKYTDNPEVDEPNPRFQQKDTRRSRLLSHTLVFVGTSLLWILVQLTIYSSHHTTSPTVPPQPNIINTTLSYHHNITTNAHLLTCGTTVSEALSLGCKYDVLVNNFIPLPCFDQDFIDEYLDDNSWGAYADEEMTVRLTTPEEISQREYYWTSTRDHINHCGVMWKKQFYVLFEERGAVDTVIANPKHTDHCAQYLMDVTEKYWSTPTKVDRGFAGCWIREK